MRARGRRTGARISSSRVSECERMTRKSFRPIAAALLTVAVLAAPCPAAAANKEHQQLMADLRMLQEQSQQLQNMLGTLAEAIKAVNARLEQQAETNRKSVADEK